MVLLINLACCSSLLNHVDNVESWESQFTKRDLRCDYVFGKMYYVVAFMQCKLGLLACNVRNIRVCCISFLNTFFFAK